MKVVLHDRIVRIISELTHASGKCWNHTVLRMINPLNIY
jgi:hypothetical protein